MSRGRHSGSASAQNLDSLLDTMANVVGILVVLMAVTQLTVNDAFERIRVSESDQAKEISERLVTLERKLAAIGPTSLTDALDTARLRTHIDRLRSSPQAVATDAQNAPTQVAQLTLQARRLEKQVSAQNAELANLRIHQTEYEERPVPAAKELRLPDPRPAPLGAKPITLLCRYGRVLNPELDRLESDLVEVFRRSRGMSVAYFRDHDVGNRDLRWQMVNSGRTMLAQLEWRRTTAGESLDELQTPKAALRADLARYDPATQYIRFLVWADSFEVYLEARRIAETAGFSVGWEPYETERNLTFVQGAEARPTPVD